jgi:hypothetical protein
MRQKDGIVCLVNPSIRRHCKTAGSSDYHLSVSIHGHRIHSVYFPPSFPIDDLLALLIFLAVMEQSLAI